MSVMWICNWVISQFYIHIYIWECDLIIYMVFRLANFRQTAALGRACNPGPSGLRPRILFANQSSLEEIIFYRNIQTTTRLHFEWTFFNIHSRFLTLLSCSNLHRKRINGKRSIRFERHFYFIKKKIKFFLNNKNQSKCTSLRVHT